VSETRFTVRHSAWARACCWWHLVRHWSQVSPSGIEAVVVDACWHEISHYKRLSSIRRVVLLRTAIYDVGYFGTPRAGGYKWQYILVAAFSSLRMLPRTPRHRHTKFKVSSFSRCWVMRIPKCKSKSRDPAPIPYRLVCILWLGPLTFGLNKPNKRTKWRHDQLQCDWDIAILPFRLFCWKMLIPAHLR